MSQAWVIDACAAKKASIAGILKRTEIVEQFYCDHQTIYDLILYLVLLLQQKNRIEDCLRLMNHILINIVCWQSFQWIVLSKYSHSFSMQSLLADIHII